MGRVEEITLPARFITTATHLIATLTIVYDAVRRPRRRARARVPFVAAPAARARAVRAISPARWAFKRPSGVNNDGRARHD